MMRKMLAGVVLGMWGITATAEPVTIAAMGDSLTQGYGLDQQEGFVPQLAAWLAARGAEVELINAGVSGDTTAGGAARAAWTLTPDVDAMIVALGANDLLRGLDPSLARANLDTILMAAQTAGVQVLLVGLIAPGNYGPEYKAAFDAIYPELAAQYGVLYAPNFLAGIMGDDGRAMAPMMQGDSIHPNAKGVARIVAVLGPDVLKLVEKVEDTR